MNLGNAREVKAYYTIFLNAMSTIAKNFGRRDNQEYGRRFGFLLSFNF
jgi:hypothetical protein